MAIFKSKKITDKQAEQLREAQRLAHKNRKPAEYFSLCTGLGNSGLPMKDAFLYQMGMVESNLKSVDGPGRISRNIIKNLTDIMLVALPEVNPKYPTTDMNTRLATLDSLGYGVKKGYEMLSTDAKYSYFRAVQDDIANLFNSLKPSERKKEEESLKRREKQVKINAKKFVPMYS